MKFELPRADRSRMMELLEYLSRPCEHYPGNRAEDFKKCFDVESEWCWKYADLALRGIERRDLGYSEGHHIVPVCFYGKRGRKVDEGNLTVLTYGEHLWAHYCLVQCATGSLQGKMARAFLLMYTTGMTGSRALMPSEVDLLDAIPDMELRRIQTMEPNWVKVEAEGRTHYSDDPVQYFKDYREATRGKKKAYYETNWEKFAEYKKVYYENNKEKIAEYKKAYREANREKIAGHLKAYREANREKLAEHKKAYREANREKIAEWKKDYYVENKEKISEQKKVRYEAKKATGYRLRKNPLTGKKTWVFVGNQIDNKELSPTGT